MIFAHTLDKVICGEKWQTRRIVKAGEAFDLSQQRVRVNDKRTVYEIGKTYAVQPNRGKKAIARIRLTDVRREKIGVISEADARAEGFASRDEFLKTWRDIHGSKADLKIEVWVLEFELDTLHPEAIKEVYGKQFAANRSADYSHDLPVAIAGIPRTGLHSGHNTVGRVGTPVSNRLSLSAKGTTIPQVSVDSNRPGTEGRRK
jgi:hypothetical protein